MEHRRVWGTTGPIVALALLVGVLAAGPAPAQDAGDTVEVLVEGFEGDAGYTTSEPQFVSGPNDFFTVTDGSNVSPYLSVTGAEGGHWFFAQDIDAGNVTLPITMHFDDLDIAGLTDLRLSLLAAEDDDPFSGWDELDHVHVDASLDDGPYQPVLWLETPALPRFNAWPLVDSDFDGVGDGTEVTDTFAPLTAEVAGEGDQLDLRISFSLDEGDEDIALDEIRLTGVSTGPQLQGDGDTDVLPFEELYRARNGDPDRRERADRIYVERNVELAAELLEVDDWDRDGDGWALVGRTNGAGNNGELANFWVDDDGVPWVATRHHRKGCLTLTPRSLEEVRKGQTRFMTGIADTANCRTEPPEADVDGDGTPDDEQDLYRIRDDGRRIHIDRSVAAAEAQLGVSDWDRDGDGWSAYSRTNGSGEYGVFVDLVVDADGVPTIRVEHHRKGCQVLRPNRTDTVAKGQTRRMRVVERPGGECS